MNGNRYRLVVAIVTAAVLFGVVGAPVFARSTPAGRSPSGSGEPPTEGTGHRNVPAVTFESFAEVAAYGRARFPDDRPPLPPEEKTEQAKRDKERSDSGEADPTTKQMAEMIGTGAGRAGRSGGGIQPQAPVLGIGFAGMTGGNPPDSHMAAGPHDLIIAVNTGIRVRRKDGTDLNPNGNNVSLNQFFASIATGSNNLGAFDPRAVFDPYLQRFWVIATDVVNPAGGTAGISELLVALSDTDEAAGGWSFRSVNMRLDGSTDVDQWCDYPMLGVSSDAIFISCNMFNFPTGTSAGYRHAKVRIMTKLQFLTGNCCFWADRWGLQEGTLGVGRSFTVQPAIMYNASGFGEFLVNAHGGGGQGDKLEVWHISNAAVCCVPGAQSLPTWRNHDIVVGSFPAPPSAPQPGTNMPNLDTGDTRLQFAFFDGGSGLLSTGQSTACDDGSGGLDACLGFTEIDVGGSNFPNSMVLVNDWALDLGNGVDGYYPAVARNAVGDKTMAFASSSASQFASAVFIGIPRRATCTGCVDGPVTTMATGTQAAGCTPTPPATSCEVRWGDYLAASPDPDGVGIWVGSQALLPVGNPPTLRRTTWVGLTQEQGDFTPPVTTAAVTGPPNAPSPDDGWHLAKPVKVTLTATDAGVGPWKISYGVTNGQTTVIPSTTVVGATTSFQLTNEGVNTVRFKAIDNWGNEEAEKSILVMLDTRRQKIVFASDRDGNREIYVMNLDGTGLQRLTNNPADDTQPVLDEQARIYFASDRDGDYDIYRLDTTGVRKLTQNNVDDLDPSVNGQGTKVAFASRLTGRFEIWTMNSDGTGLQGPLDPGRTADREPDWSPSGRLAYADAEFGDYDIELTNPAGVLGTLGNDDRRPAWSRSGTTIAAYRDGDIVAHVVSTGNVMSLTSGAATDDAPTWSARGGFLAFHTDRTGNNEIFRMDASGTGLTNLTNMPGSQEVEPDWMPIGDGFNLGLEVPQNTITVGTPGTLEVRLSNGAPFKLHGARLELFTGGGFTFGTAGGPGADCAVEPRRVLCSLGDVERGGTREIQITATAEEPGPVAIRAVTTSENGDTDSTVQAFPVVADTRPTAHVDVLDRRFEPADLLVEQGTRVEWRFLGPSRHTVTDSSGIGLFDSGPRSPKATFARRFNAAATVPYRCELHPARMQGTVAVPIDVRRAGFDGALALGWATAPPRRGLVHDVQVRFRAPDGPWSGWLIWRRGTRAMAGVFEPDRGPGAYEFRARIREPKSRASTGWSPSGVHDVR